MVQTPLKLPFNGVLSLSEKKHIARAAGVLGGATILSRVMGMVRDMVVSRLFGAGFATDAFFAAFQIPNMLRRFFAEGALTSAFVPTFSEVYTQQGEREARELANTCFTLLTIVMAGITILGICFSPQLVSLMFPGYAAEPSKQELTILLNRLMFPYIFFVSLVALCMGILNTLRHFFTPAISTVFLNVAMIFCAALLHRSFAVPIVSLAVGVLAGGVLQLLLQLPVLWRKGFPVRPRFDFNQPAVRRIVLLMGPSIFGVGVYYLNITVGNILASLLPQGSVSYLYYAQRLFEFPQGVFTVSVAQAVLPSMSRQAAAGEIGELKDSLRFGLRLMLFITIPAMAGLMVCATPIFSLLFMGGEFDYVKAEQCGRALVQYSFGLSCVAMVRVLAPAFYALKDTRTPVVAAFIAFIVNFICSLVLMRFMQHAGLALASSISAGANMLLLFFLLRRKIGAFGGLTIAVAGAKSLVAAIPACLAAALIMQQLDWSRTGVKLLKSGVLGLAVLAAVLLYALISLLIKSEEAQEAKRVLSRRFVKG
jgi:putative peptidoglycan lipid II flippase